MSDLVERLREEAKYWIGAPDADVVVKVLQEAADEIDRLRLDLENARIERDESAEANKKLRSSLKVVAAEGP